jgi:hypothetical protein
MLAYILAIAIALASVVLFFSAFFAPKLHRKDDFLWSGVGLFYGLILWLCAGRFTGGALLGQMAAVVLVLSFAWQTISLRAAIANPEKQAGIKTFSLVDWIGGGLGKKKAKVPPTAKPAVETVTSVEKTESAVVVENEIPETVPTEEAISPEIKDETIQAIAEVQTSVSPEGELVQEVVITEITDTIENITEESSPEKTEKTITPPRARTSQPFAKPKKQGFFSKLFGKKPVPPKTENITAALDAIETVEETGEQNESTNKVNVTQTKTVQERAIITENLDSEESDISVTEVITQIETVELPEVVSASETPADNEIEENWDDDWEAENDSEISQVITDQSAPTMIENAIAETPIETNSEEENLAMPETEEQIDPSSGVSSKFAPYIEPTLEEKPLFGESSEETTLESETPRSPIDSSPSTTEPN